MIRIAALYAVIVLSAFPSALVRHAAARTAEPFVQERMELRAETADGRVWWVPTPRREIALTFDDGPYPFYTPLLLHALDSEHVPATFFLVGRSVQAYPELALRILASGDEIGNHTLNHYKLTGLNDMQIASQIADCGSLLESYANKPITLFRPPHGRYNARVLNIAQRLGYRTILWSDAPDDAPEILGKSPLPPAEIARRVLTRAQPGGIVLMHSGQLNTVLAIPEIVDSLRAKGYRFVTVSELLRADGDDAAGGAAPATR
ncbi:MAG TPA: polysaccharide deacetylase family protein [Candidatus Tumulicola sp.]|nr:polysaccharide deacetylase family protein [Candidatus Tumulicola sp.]